MSRKLKDGDSFDDLADVTGEVIAADLLQRQFYLSGDAESRICVPFVEGQEEIVTTALQNHKWARLRVQGRGEYSRSGQLLRITQVDQMTLLDSDPDGLATVPSKQSIEDVLKEIAAEVPDSEWDKLSKDLSAPVDHYVYGTQKRAKQ